MVGGNNNNNSNNTFAKTICSICYEDLKPNIEDLQSISICGHVFHELCIQQWFEYCANGKKKNCPVCKQTCSEGSVSRLYFQSVGDLNDQSLSQKPLWHCEENPEELRREVKRLENKVLGLISVLECQQKDLEEVNGELGICKEQLKREKSTKTDALKQKATIQQLLQMRAGELDISTSECARLQERNMALAKELAALKLVSDINLEEDEILKLASLGKDGNNKETIDVLRKSLVIRNKSYKELMAKCNSLGRGEARSLGKLEKAGEKIKKLKTRVQELEMAVEAKDNEILRTLKSSKKNLHKGDCNLNSSSINKSSLRDQMKEPAVPVTNLDETKNVSKGSFCPWKTENLKRSMDKGIKSSKDEVSALKDDYASAVPLSIHKLSNLCSQPQANEAATILPADFDKKINAQVDEPNKKDQVLGSRSVNKGEAVINPDGKDEDMTLLDETMQDRPSLNIRKETSLPFSVAQPGDRCFSGGLLGPDGTNRHLGKWCKRANKKGPEALSTGASTGDLIAVGADGRGGRIKVLRSLNHPSLQDGKETSTTAKRCKYGAKTSNSPSQGYLQLEHFFGRAGQ
ncbi:hypothetical protein LguiA_019073 [Lonicera macranthoides]